MLEDKKRDPLRNAIAAEGPNGPDANPDSRKQKRSLPWPELMAVGLGVLRLPPAHFWSMTPRELAAAADALGLRAQAPITRAQFDSLMQRFPDRPHSNPDPAHD